LCLIQVLLVRIFHSWTYQKGSVILQLNGSLDQAKADEYGKVIAALP
jgi:hypothetical protein